MYHVIFLNSFLMSNFHKHEGVVVILATDREGIGAKVAIVLGDQFAVHRPGNLLL